MKIWVSLFATVIAFTCQVCLAEIIPAGQQRVVYPDGTVRYETITESVPASPKVITSTSGTTCCTLCGDTDCDGCKDGLNEPVIISSGGPHCEGEGCEDITPKVEGELEKINVDEKFYHRCIDFKAPVRIPVLVCRTKETYEFKTLHVNADKCCKYKVCVPCKRCETCEKTCELRPKEVKLRICLRQDKKTVDVYVLDVPGMPKEWLLYVNYDLSSAQSELGFTM